MILHFRLTLQIYNGSFQLCTSSSSGKGILVFLTLHFRRLLRHGSQNGKQSICIKTTWIYQLLSMSYRVAKTFLNKSVQKSVHFQKKSVQSVQFLKKNPYKIRAIFFLKICTIRTFFQKSVHFFKKICTISTIFEKIPFLKKKH